MSGEAKVWVGGELAPRSPAVVSVRDRGYTLGDGLFETVRVRGGLLRQWDRHLRRLRSGAVALGLPLPWTDEQLTAAVRAVLRACGTGDAALRLTVSRGVPQRRGLLPDEGSAPTLAVEAEPSAGYPAELYERGMRAVTATAPRNELSPLARVKSLSYLENVLARREAAVAGADEALLCNTKGWLACASAATVFLVLDGVLVTPEIASGALPGTTRALLLEEVALRLGLRVEERPVAPSELLAAEEAFLSSALLGVMPLTSVDGRCIGTGSPGALSVRLRSAVESASAQSL